MKKKFVSLLIITVMIFGSAFPVFAAVKLEKPVIEEVEIAKNSIKLDWNSIKHADEYKVYRSTSKDGKYKCIATTDESWYRDSEITKGKKYYYKVKAFSDGEYENSSYSKWRSGKVEKAKSAVSISSTAGNSSDTIKKSTPGTSSGGGVVYITKTGEKYHEYGCRYLKSCIEISYNDAVSRGYTACSVCH